MKNCITNFSQMGMVLLLIGVLGILNAVCDTVTLILIITQSFEGSTFFSFFFRVFADSDLFLIAMPLTILCNILFLIFMFRRKLFLFQLFFFASCIIALIHLLINLFAVYPLTIFDIMVNTNISPIILSIINPMSELLRTMYLAFITTGSLTSLGLLIICFIYFKRSKRIAAYFGSVPQYMI
ncbi:MAG: hypothetical protein Ta2B_00730 [Termitinemataceae bacterium]|nr:MAG: hypothetical protein Ta2B_00730 [Termitinemataceae bacterium]